MKIKVECQSVSTFIGSGYVRKSGEGMEERSEIQMQTMPHAVNGVWMTLSIFGPAALAELFPFRKPFVITIEPEEE